MPKFQAIRKTKGSKKIVEIIDEAGQVVATTGGARAERAQAAVVSYWKSDQRTPNVELRSDVLAAQTLAAGYLRSREVRIRGRASGILTNVAVHSVALLIEEAAV